MDESIYKEIDDYLNTVIHCAYQKLHSLYLGIVKKKKTVKHMIASSFVYDLVLCNKAVAIEKTQIGDLKLVNSVLWHGS